MSKEEEEEEEEVAETKGHTTESTIQPDTDRYNPHGYHHIRRGLEINQLPSPVLQQQQQIGNILEI